MDLQFVPIDDQVVDIFTKPLIEERLILLRNQLRMIFVKECFNIFMLSTITSKDIFSNGL